MPDPLSPPVYEGPVHCELVVDGDASSLAEVVIYEAGTTRVVTLGARTHFFLTDVLVMLEDGGDFSLTLEQPRD